MAQGEGKKFAFDDESKLAKWVDIETFELPEREVEAVPQLCSYKNPEFSAVCPFSGLPDVATVLIQMMPGPGRRLPELKSLKYYFQSFRNVGIYQEGVTKRIFEDLALALDPTYLRVRTIYNTRGGIDTTCDQVYAREGFEEQLGAFLELADRQL